MEWIQLWAGITFAAQNGDVEGLLTAAAAGGLHLFDIVPRPGGFSARCAAWHYRKLAALARRRRVAIFRGMILRVKYTDRPEWILRLFRYPQKNMAFQRRQGHLIQD